MEREIAMTARERERLSNAIHCEEVKENPNLRVSREGERGG